MVHGMFPVHWQERNGVQWLFCQAGSSSLGEDRVTGADSKECLMKGKGNCGPRHELSNSLNAATENVFPGTTYTSLAWAALRLPCLGEVNSTFNFSSCGLLQTTPASLDSSAVFAPLFLENSIFTWYKLWGTVWASRLVTNKATGTDSFLGSDERKEMSLH